MWELQRRLETALAAQDRLLWAVRVRWVTIAGFSSLAMVAYAGGVFGSLWPALSVAVIGGALNAVNGWCVRRGRHVLAVSAVAIPMDHIFTTYLVVHTGGAHSPFIVLYVVAVLATAMLVETFVAAASALLAVGLWGVAIALDRSDLVSMGGLLTSASPGWVSATWGAFLCYCLILLVYLGGYISERLRSSERDLAERHRRLEETVATLGAAHAELQQAYQRLRQTEAQLIQSEKLRGLGQLVAGVAHELNNPISFIAGNVEHLRSYVQRLSAALRAYAALELPAALRAAMREQCEKLGVEEAIHDLPGLLDDCEEGARRTKGIVNELRAFARSEERENWRRVDIRQGIESTLALLGHRLRGHVCVHRDLGDLPDVECLPGQLNQVFMNLFANAIDAIGARPGNIWITARLVEDAAVPQVQVQIRDDGSGIPAAVQPRIFEPFFTTKEVGKGTGLGLSVSYGIVQRHHGRLEVTSGAGEGTSFTLSLPIAQGNGSPGLAHVDAIPKTLPGQDQTQ